MEEQYSQIGVPGGTKEPIPLKGFCERPVLTIRGAGWYKGPHPSKRCVKHQYSQFGAPGGTKAEKDHGFIQAQHWTLSPHPDAKPLHQQQHRLPIEQRIKYKIACLCYQIISGTAPQYLAESFQIYVPSRSLQSSSDNRTFRIPTFERKQHGGRAFRFSAAQSFVFICKVRWVQKHAINALSFLSQRSTKGLVVFICKVRWVQKPPMNWLLLLLLLLFQCNTKGPEALQVHTYLLSY